MRKVKIALNSEKGECRMRQRNPNVTCFTSVLKYFVDKIFRVA